MGNRILITGASGYLGGRLVQWLLQNTSNTIILGSRQKKSFFSDKIPVVETNWTSFEQLQSICENIDIVIHLAAMDASQSLVYPVEALEMNGVGTARLLNAAISKKVRKFIYLSTSHVYGQKVGNISEKLLPLPIHPYATSHKAGEDVVLAANALCKIEGIVLRLSNSFGSPLNKDINCWNLLVPQLCRQLVEEKKITLLSSGYQMRNFIPIIDACRAISFFISIESKQFQFGVFNIGSKLNLSVLDMAKIIQFRYFNLKGEHIDINRVNKEVEKSHIPYSYDISKLEKLNFTFTQGIDETIDDLLIFCLKYFHAK
jgi:UDP-glucose 4-epimerase